MVTVTISYCILCNYSESAKRVRRMVRACDVSSACAACGHVDSVDSVEGRTLEIRNVLCRWEPLGGDIEIVGVGVGQFEFHHRQTR